MNNTQRWIETVGLGIAVAVAAYPPWTVAWVIRFSESEARKAIDEIVGELVEDAAEGRIGRTSHLADKLMDATWDQSRRRSATKRAFILNAPKVEPAIASTLRFHLDWSRIAFEQGTVLVATVALFLLFRRKEASERV